MVHRMGMDIIKSFNDKSYEKKVIKLKKQKN